MTPLPFRKNTRATDVFRKHASELEEGAALLRALDSPNLRFTESTDESKALDQFDGFHIVIAASGMCEAGRIRHRLRNWLWRPEATVLFVGYQAQGTLGRILLDGASAVRIQGDEIKVRARLRSLDLYSGHADAPELAAVDQGVLRMKEHIHAAEMCMERARRLVDHPPGLPARRRVLRLLGLSRIARRHPLAGALYAARIARGGWPGAVRGERRR